MFFGDQAKVIDRESNKIDRWKRKEKKTKQVNEQRQGVLKTLSYL